MSPKSKFFNTRALLMLALCVLPSLAFAHSRNDGDGFMAGLMHPVFGFDHLLAMVSVGILSSQLGGAHIWRVPTTFVTSMVIGGALGIMQVPFPIGELGIAWSVVVLGIAIVRAHKEMNPYLPYLFVSLFGMFHGHAHGLEMPRSASPAFYTFGFLISTSVLHIVGVIIGEISTRREKFYKVLRYVGAGMSGVGFTFLLTALGFQIV
ncbi:MAG: hypothetical protein JWN23_2392 [Rhodocyclales bacterium]|nr:hypothetical protein [Rhodocyclales bacterium]